MAEQPLVVELSEKSIKAIQDAVRKGVQDGWSGTINGEVDLGTISASAFLDIVDAIRRSREDD